MSDYAFPYANEEDKQYNWLNRGMTLRDYFAAKAMQAICTTDDGNGGMTFAERAEWAYMQADLMLEERDK